MSQIDLSSDQLSFFLNRTFDDALNEVMGLDHAKTKRVEHKLFHYTDAAGLMGIIKEQEFWATDIRFMNDSTELIYAKKLCREVIERELNSCRDEIERNLINFLDNSYDLDGFSHIFAISFSESEDDLALWRAYGNNCKGYSIGFDFRSQTTHPDLYQDDVPWCMMKMEYNPEIQRSQVYNVIKCAVDTLRKAEEAFGPEYKKKFMYIIRDRAKYELFYIMARLKHPAFESEKEWRIVYTVDSSLVDERVLYRVSQNRIVPYIIVQPRNKAGDNSDKLPVEVILQGSVVDSEADCSLLYRLLRRHRYPFATARKSSVPIRF